MSSLVYGPTLTSIHGYWKKNIYSFDYFVSNVSGFYYACYVFNSFPSKEKACFIISWLQSLTSVILELNKINSDCLHCFSIYFCHEVMGPDVMILVFRMLSFQPTFSLFSFTFIKKLFSSLLSAMRVVASVHLKLLIFLLEILTPACASLSPAFCMTYSAYKLNKQSDNIQP